MSDGTVYNLLRNSDLTRNVLTAVTTAATGKAAYYRRANMGNAADPAYDSAGMHFTGPTIDSNPNSGVGVEFAASDLGLVNGDTYVLSVEVASLAAADANNGLTVWQHADKDKWWTGKATRSEWSSGAGVYHTSFVYDGSAYVCLLMSVGMTGSVTVTRFGLYHAASAAWAPAEGETLAGGGALMSANLWQAESVISSETQEGGIYACSGTRGVRTNVALDRLATNQTFHCGFSVNPGKDDKFNMTLGYRDAAGNVNFAATADVSATAGKWTRVSGSVVIPSGMTVYQMVICNDRNASGTSGWKVMNPTLSLGSPVVLASSAHTPYATQDHVSVTYATKASLKVTDDSVKAEVSARAQTDRNVADLSSRLTQTANSLTSEISDRRSAITTVTGLANTAQSTADAAKSTVDGMKLGGRNLLKGTSMDSKAVTTPTTASTTWGSGFAFPADASLRAVIPYGAEYRCSVDVLLPVDGRIVVDMNTYAEVGTSWAGNDNDNSNRRTANVFNVKANVWTRISWGSENTNDANAGKQAIYVNDSVGLLPQSAAVTWHYRGLKVELGNKATDWTPAPEDTDSAITTVTGLANAAQSTASGAVTTANGAAATANAAKNTATAAQTMATENQSSIKQLSNSITSEVTQRTKTDQMVSDLSSRLTQTADGFNASIDRLSDTDKKVNSWFGFGSDSSGNPQLTMGSSTSPVVGVYTNAGLAYKARSGATLLELDGASRSSTMPHVHADDVSIGSWQWVPTQNGTHFTLQWIGG